MNQTFRWERRERRLIGTIAVGMFGGWNLLMGAWGLAYLASATGLADIVSTGAHRFVAEFGLTDGAAMIALIWLLGMAILGLLVCATRGRKVTFTRHLSLPIARTPPLPSWQAERRLSRRAPAGVMQANGLG